MPGEAQLAGGGWGGEFWLNDGTAPYELRQVKSFTLPQDQAEEIEISHLKSPNRRREYAPGMIEGGEFEVVFNFRAGSDTHLKLQAALEAGTPRAFKAVIPERGIPTWQITGNCIVRGLDLGSVQADEAMEATATLRITGAPTNAAYAA